MFGRRGRLLIVAAALIVFPLGVSAAAGKPYLAGGVGFFNMANDVDSIDPAFSYFSTGWQIEYATCAKLVNYADAPAPDGSLLQNEVARKVLVSADGLTYTFRLATAFKFSPPSNERVTADSFKRALDRVRDPALQSPGAQFYTNIVSVSSDGDQTLTIRLAHPSGSLLARLAMPFACAVPSDTPFQRQNVPLPSAGPYYISGNATTLAQIESGTADYAMSGLPTDAYAPVASAYPAQFFVNPYPGFRYLALNTSRPLLSTVAARQAVNLAIDRASILALGGAFAGTPDDQYIPPGVAGYLDTSIYPLNGPSAADLARANALVDNAGIRGQTAVLYTSSSPIALGMASLIRDELAQIGLGVDIHAFPRSQQIIREGTLGEPFDISIEGWIDDYLDPADTLNTFFDGTTIGPANNLDVSYFNDPATNARLQADELLTGPARYAAYGSSMSISPGTRRRSRRSARSTRGTSSPRGSAVRRTTRPTAWISPCSASSADDRLSELALDHRDREVYRVGHQRLVDELRRVVR